MELVGRDVRIVAADLFQQVVPERVGEALRVALGDHRQPFAPLAGHLEAEPENPLDTAPSVNRGLQGELVVAPLVEPAARVDVFSFGVFPEYDEVDLRGTFAG